MTSNQNSAGISSRIEANQSKTYASRFQNISNSNINIFYER